MTIEEKQQLNQAIQEFVESQEFICRMERVSKCTEEIIEKLCKINKDKEESWIIK